VLLIAKQPKHTAFVSLFTYLLTY